MTTPNDVDPLRRSLIAALASAPLTGSARDAQAEQTATAAKATTLVACFSRSGNTRVVAGLIRRATNAAYVEIQPATPYPDAYLATVEQARRERDSSVEPPLQQRVPDISRYDTIYLGFPIWGGTAPPLIGSFLSAHDLAGKILVPFITHGGFGVGSSAAVLRVHAPKATLREAFVMQADQERRTMEQVSDWLRVPAR